MDKHQEAKHDAPSTEAPGAKERALPPIEPLPEGASHKQVIAKVNELVARSGARRDRGPESKRLMTPADAERIMLGDMRELPHADAAAKLELSYGQVYSARKGYTFKTTYQRSDKRW